MTVIEGEGAIRGESEARMQFAWPVLCVAAGLPPLLWVAAALFIADMTLADAASSLIFRLYYVALLLLAVSAAVSAVRRSPASFLVWSGFLLFLIQGVVWYGFRFSGEAGAGTGDQVVEYHRDDRGPWSGDTRIPARVEKIPEDGKTPIEFTLNEQKIEVPLKGSVSWNGFRISPVAVERAPLMTLETREGVNVETLFIKMGTVVPERDFFLVKTLPHRIYISPDLDKGIAVRIIRDKLVLASKTLVWGEKLYYDGHYIRFDKGEQWIRLSVERTMTPWFACSGALAMLAGLVASARKRSNR